MTYFGKTLLFLLIASSTAKVLTAQADWNGKSAAVVLTYDDGIKEDLDNVIPALDSLGLHGTFYISGKLSELQSEIQRWRRAANRGHELANHTLTHPCAKGVGRNFVGETNDLERWTIKQVTDDILRLDSFLTVVDGRKKRTFAYPCGDMKIGDSTYLDGLRHVFIAARGVFPKIARADEVDLYNVPSYVMSGQTGEEMIDLVKSAISKKGLIVFMFHGVGGGNSLNVSLESHRQLLQFLKQNESRVWITTMFNVSAYIRSTRPEADSANVVGKK
jgi:peptidoglycan/xylan/chitin deacetylase (PgdA/CDA1 family)